MISKTGEYKSEELSMFYAIFVLKPALCLVMITINKIVFTTRAVTLNLFLGQESLRKDMVFVHVVTTKIIIIISFNKIQIPVSVKYSLLFFDYLLT